MNRLTIKNVRLIDPETGLDEMGAIEIENGYISALGSNISAAGTHEDELIDGGGLIAMPGLIDMRVSTGEPGAEHRESIKSAAEAAAAGGVTSLVIMPDTNPVIDDMSLVDFIKNRGAETNINIHVAGALTKNLDAKSLTEIGLMREAGAVMFSNGDIPIEDSQTMRRLLAYSSRFNALVASRPKEPSLTRGTCAHASDFSSRLGLPAAPAAAERIMIERDVALAELTGGRLLIDQVSSADGVKALRRAHERDIDLACSVSINHLALNEIDIGDYRSFAKLDPPLREETDRQALIEGLNDGTIDVIVSAHNPRPAGEKRLPYEKASAGAVGLELLLAAVLTQVADGGLDLMKALAAMTINPASLLDLPGGRLAVGAPADIILIDPGRPWVCDSDQLLSKSNNTPFDGRRLTGQLIKTICAGKLIFSR